MILATGCLGDHMNPEVGSRRSSFESAGGPDSFCCAGAVESIAASMLIASLLLLLFIFDVKFKRWC